MITKNKYGIQMYSVRDLTEKSLREALKCVAELGYKYVEFAGFFGNTAEEVKKMLDDFGLECSGTHTHLDLLAPDKIAETIQFHKTIGCDNVIVPACDWSSPEKCDNVINALNEAQKELEKHGIRLGYHNHSLEFLPTADGIVFEDELIEKTGVELEIDTFWLFNAGKNVIEFLEEHKDRIKAIHLKDGNSSKIKKYDSVYDGVRGYSLGLGEAPVKAALDWAIANDVIPVVESEGLEPTGIEEVKRCIEFLKSVEK